MSFQQAVALHQQGRLADAERLYAEVLRREPANAAAFYMFGVLRAQQGRLEEAVAILDRAVALKPDLAEAHSNRALALAHLGRPVDALAAYDTALKLKPRDASAWVGRGSVLRNMNRPAEALASFDKALKAGASPELHYSRALALADLNRFHDALASLDRALAGRPAYPEALSAKASALQGLERLEDALASADKALALKPDFPAAHHTRGLALRRLKRSDEALAAFDKAHALGVREAELFRNRGTILAEQGRNAEALPDLEQALRAKPEDAKGWNTYGTVLNNLERPQDALAALDKAVGLDADYATAHYNRGLILAKLGRPEEAITAFERASALDPSDPESVNDLGLALKALKRLPEALAAFNRVLALKPNYARAYNNRATVFWELDRSDDALADFGRAIAADPAMALARRNRGHMLWVRNQRYAEAIADLEEAVRLEPDCDFGRGDLIHFKTMAGDWRGFDADCDAITAAVRAGKNVIQPFGYQPLSSSPADLKTCAEVHARSNHPAQPVMFQARHRKPGRIRLGYVCGEFREHATSFLTAGLYECHDQDRFEVFAFDNGYGDGSRLRGRLEAAFAKIIPIKGIGSHEAATLAQAHDIDILVNLNGYYGEARMDMFAHRPAPVQVNYLGFPGTLGASYMDYIIADATVLPAGEQAHFTEKVVTLPCCYQVNDSKRGVPEPSSRALQGLPEDAFVFCYFNHSYKLTPFTFAVWMSILRQAPGSLLWVLNSIEPVAVNLRREAADHGIDPARIVAAGMAKQEPHLARLPVADLFLDSLPYNAHTTGSDALWMGLPLLTCRGTTFAGRVAASLLESVGVPELIAENVHDYEARAVAFARDPARLKNIRARLIAARETAPLYDTARYTRHLEAGYSAMMEIWSRGDAPRAINVPR